MDIKRALPSPGLRSVVRSFEERRADLGSAVLTWPVAARPHQILNVYLAEPYQVRIDGGPAKTSPEMSVVGPLSDPRKLRPRFESGLFLTMIYASRQAKRRHAREGARTETYSVRKRILGSDSNRER